MTGRVRSGGVGVGVLALLAGVVLGGVVVSGPGAAAATGPTASSPIGHVVVMTQEGHSFDSYLGRRHGVDGRPSGVCLPVERAAASPCQRPFALARTAARPRLDSSAAAQATAVADGRMDGFVLAQASSRRTGRDAMGYYRPADLPVLNQLADHGVVFDRWFSAVPGGGIVNQLFAVSGAAAADVATVPEAGWPDLPVVFDRLEAAGVSWKVYVENYEPALTGATAGVAARRGGQVARVPLLAMPRYERDPALTSHVADLGDYYRDLRSDSLPAVSWVVTTSSTEKSPSRPVVGQGAVRDVVNALGESSAWPDSMFVLSYDSPGGWYDHVVPPRTVDGRLGLRVPTVLVSPYARAGSVDHTTLDSAAVLRFLQDNWSLAPLSTRVSASPGLGSALRFDRPAQAPVLVSAAQPRPPIDQPNGRVIVVGYLTAILVAAGSVLWAARDRAAIVPADVRLDTP